MDKNIKYLIEDIINFNPASYSDEGQDIIDQDTLSNVLETPKNKEDLIKIIQKRVDENKYGNDNLVFPDLSDIDVSNITDMSNLFFKLFRDFQESPVMLDLSGWDVSNVNDMRNMFGGCRSLTKLNLSGWNTSKVTNMDFMFEYCKMLPELDLSIFDTSNVTSMN